MGGYWDHRKLYAGGIFAGIGAFFVFQATQMEIGTITNLGPGGFPLGLGVILVCLGLTQVFSARTTTSAEKIEWLKGRAPLLIPISVAIFGLLIDRLGLVVAILATSVVAGFANDRIRVPEIAIIAVLLTIFCVALFVYALGLTFPMFRL